MIEAYLGSLDNSFSLHRPGNAIGNININFKTQCSEVNIILNKYKSIQLSLNSLIRRYSPGCDLRNFAIIGSTIERGHAICLICINRKYFIYNPSQYSDYARDISELSQVKAEVVDLEGKCTILISGIRSKDNNKDSILVQWMCVIAPIRVDDN